MSKACSPFFVIVRYFLYLIEIEISPYVYKQSTLLKHLGSRGRAPCILISAMNGVECLVWRCCRLISGERTPVLCWIRGWVSTRVGLNTLQMEKFLDTSIIEVLPFGRPASSPVAIFADISVILIRILYKEIIIRFGYGLRNVNVFWSFWNFWEAMLS